MLDLFSNVFGKSKKTNGKSNDKDETSSIDKSNNLYPTIILTDQMLKGDSTTPPLNSFEIVETPLPTTNLTPFKTNDSVIVTSNNRQKTFSPLDNVPFSINSSNEQAAENSLNDLHDCFNLLNSVTSYLANSEYKFTQEKTILYQL